MAKVEIKTREGIKEVLINFQDEDFKGSFGCLTYLSKKEVTKLIKELREAKKEVWQKPTT